MDTNSILMRSGINTVSALSRKEKVISRQFHVQVHRRCIVHKQPGL